MTFSKNSKSKKLPQNQLKAKKIKELKKSYKEASNKKKFSNLAIVRNKSIKNDIFENF